ncbi:MAG TPA: enoyl-CoA hydratase/isomerase family protein [Sphingomonas sp.]|nr:enoyl-CoA hydratase/isomerase family protein [Sphingomonas sp.]
MTQASQVIFEEDGAVGVITIHRPPVNAISSDLRAQLSKVLTASLAREISVLLIRGEGRGFSAGADTKEFAGRGGDPVRTAESLSEGSRFWETIYDVRVPVVAAMHGFAVGAGFMLSTLCDFRLASASCKISLPEIAVGISVGGGGAQLRRLGLREGFIRDLLMNGDVIDAGLALKEGLVDRVFPDESFDQDAIEFCRHLARHGRDALIAMKTALNITEVAADWRSGLAQSRGLSVSFVDAHVKRLKGGAA